MSKRKIQKSGSLLTATKRKKKLLSTKELQGLRGTKKETKKLIKLKSKDRNGGTRTLKPLTKEMLEIRQRLSNMLAQTRRDIDHEVRGASERDLAHINDTLDMATDAAEGDLALRIAESETAEASEIERAIEKIDTGTYGMCEVCNQAIGADRLKFLPYVTLCIKCQALAEIRKREESEELDDLAEGAESDNDA